MTNSFKPPINHHQRMIMYRYSTYSVGYFFGLSPNCCLHTVLSTLHTVLLPLKLHLQNTVPKRGIQILISSILLEVIMNKVRLTFALIFSYHSTFGTVLLKDPYNGFTYSVWMAIYLFIKKTIKNADHNCLNIESP